MTEIAARSGFDVKLRNTLYGRCTSLLRVVVSEMTYTVSSGTLNSSIPYTIRSDNSCDVCPHGHISVDIDPKVTNRSNWLHVSAASADRIECDLMLST